MVQKCTLEIDAVQIMHYNDIEKCKYALRVKNEVQNYAKKNKN